MGNDNDSEKKNWRDILKNVNLESQLNSAGAPPWVADLLRKAATLSVDAASSAGEKLGKTLNTVQMPVTLSKEILRETMESLLDNYSLDIQAKIDFKKKDKNLKGADNEK